MDDKSKLLICRKHIVYLALSTRLAVIILQFISNILIIDHNPDVFQSPKEQLNVTLFDRVTTTFLGGLLRWDAQYFYHVAKYGYTYENTLAFFPLFPLTTKILAIPFTYIFPFLDWDSIALILFVTLNIYFFVKAALALFDLSVIILNRKLAYRTTFLFCINPASIFFVAPYTECMYSYISFAAMLNCAEIYYKNTKSKAFSNSVNLLSISVPIALSAATRSNGILNIGYLLYFWILFFKKTYWPHNIATLIHLVKCIFVLVLNVVICLLPFITFQVYGYQHFCTDFKHNLSKDLVNYANDNKLVLPGTFSKHNQTWCFSTLPLAYSYVQEKYWNVGFLKYYELKQIPNFLLALPIVCLILSKSFIFAKQHLNYCLNLGMFEFNYNLPSSPSKDDNSSNLYDKKMFVFLLHASVLTIFCVFCIHVQVTTRMLCSASPVLFWFCAYAFENVSPVDFDLFTSWKGFLFNNDLNSEQKFIKYYFLSYFIVGTVLFSNNFPWT